MKYIIKVNKGLSINKNQMLQTINSALILQTSVSVYSDGASPPASLSLWVDTGELYVVSIEGIVPSKKNKARVFPAVINS